MFRKYFTYLVMVFLILSCHRGPRETQLLDILVKLRALPGITVTEIEPYYGYPRAFQIDLIQPVDHHNPGGWIFVQRMYLSHVDESMPMIFAPSGYASFPTSGQEIAGILGTNCLSVTHRYFEGSRPQPLDWEYLTVEQAAADHHRIVALFKRIYQGIWISSGRSKSGETVLHHRRFYPDDVQATIAYVAPIVLAPHDQRFPEFLETVGDRDCRDKLKRFQRALLENRESLIPLVEGYFQENELVVSMDINVVFEYAVIDYMFLFWQYHLEDCASIPGPDASLDEMFTHFKEVGRLSVFSDGRRAYYEPYYYQCLTEIGGAGFKTDHLDDLLIYVREPTNEDFAPKDVEFIFKPEVVLDILHWLQTEGNNIIYIYGSIDPWTAGAIELTGGTNALRIIHEGGDHRVRIADLDNPELVISTLEQWLGIAIGQVGRTFRIELDWEETTRNR